MNQGCTGKYYKLINKPKLLYNHLLPKLFNFQATVFHALNKGGDSKKKKNTINTIIINVSIYILFFIIIYNLFILIY